jgi:hypothetical protein
MKNGAYPSFDILYKKVRGILEEAKANAYRVANTEMVQVYWRIGQMIVKEEQKGSGRAEYGKSLLIALSERLTLEYGKGFDESNLRNLRKFYLVYQKRDALRPELSWTHYRILMRIETDDVREFYLKESIEGNWSTRQLERQVSSHYYERVLMTPKDNRSLVKQEAENKKEQMEPAHIIKDPLFMKVNWSKH